MPKVASQSDEHWMRRALALAEQSVGLASPNPAVGCVLVKDDQIIGEGFHAYELRDHAEIVALKAAGPAAKGSTAYTTLEPCSHTGRTGPCADALIEAGVARVVVGMVDPDRNVSGEGVERLRAAGVIVDVGLYEERVRTQLAPYVKHRTTGRPWVVLKLAASLDGGTAAPDGSSQWITSGPARADGHRLRAESDAIIIGAGTVRRDNPSLTVRDYKPPVVPKGGV